MKKMIAITLMLVGVVSLTSGIILYGNSKSETAQNSLENQLEEVIKMAIADGVLTDNERNEIRNFATRNELDYSVIINEAELRLKKSGTKSETELINYSKKNGDDFEKFVVQKFDKKYFNIKEWAGDKYINGTYAQTTPQPDLLLEFSFKQDKSELSVECKWRQNFYKGGIEFASEAQLKRYKKFEADKNNPVFIAIGIDGTGANPKNLYVVPLKEINSNFIDSQTLSAYKKNIEKNFFFNNETKILN